MPAVQQRLEDLIATLSEEITEWDAELAAAVAPNSAGALNVALRVTLPGSGLLTALGLVVAPLNFSGGTRVEELVSYAGLAPRPRQAGTALREPSRIGHSGHGPLRKAVYRATLSAGRHNPPIQAFYTRLREAGKPMQGARWAAARKLLHLAGAVGTKQQSFNAAHGAAPQEPPIAA